MAHDHFGYWWRSRFSCLPLNEFKLTMSILFDFATSTTLGAHCLLPYGDVVTRDTAGAVREAVHEPAPPLAYAPVVPGPGLLVAHATLSVSQLQNLEEQLAALTKACVDYFGVEPTFSLRIEVQPKLPVRVEHVEKVNRILEEVSPELRLG